MPRSIGPNWNVLQLGLTLHHWNLIGKAASDAGATPFDMATKSHNKVAQVDPRVAGLAITTTYAHVHNHLSLNFLAFSLWYLSFTSFDGISCVQVAHWSWPAQGA